MLERHQEIADRLAAEQIIIPVVEEEQLAGGTFDDQPDRVASDALLPEVTLTQEETTVELAVDSRDSGVRSLRPRPRSCVVGGLLCILAGTGALGYAVHDYNSPSVGSLADPTELEETLPEHVADALTREPELPEPSFSPDIAPSPVPEPSDHAEEEAVESLFQPVELSRITDMQIVGRVSGVEIQSELLLDDGLWYIRSDGTPGVVLNPERSDVAYLYTQGSIDLGVEMLGQSADADSIHALDGEFRAVGNIERPIIFEGHAGLGVGIFGLLHAVKPSDVLIVRTAKGEFIYELIQTSVVAKGVDGTRDQNNPLVDPVMSPNIAYVAACIPDPEHNGRSTTAMVATFKLIASTAFSNNAGGLSDPAAVPTNAEFLSGNIS